MRYPKCKRCGKEIDHVLINHFNREGTDSYCRVEIDYYPPTGAVSIMTDSAWTGYELTEDEMRETIECPYCKEYPFDDEIEVYDRVEVVCFTEVEE